MRIAITSTGSNLEASIDPRFGRCSYFIVYDSDSGQFNVLDNGVNVNMSGGAGIQAAKTVIDANVQAILTGHCGPKAFRAIAETGVKVYTTPNSSVKEAIDRFLQGKLEMLSGADVQGHWK